MFYKVTILEDNYIILIRHFRQIRLGCTDAERETSVQMKREVSVSVYLDDFSGSWAFT